MKYCVNTQNCINKKDLMDYGFCDESGNYIVKINKDKLKELYGADDIIFQENYHL